MDTDIVKSPTPKVTFCGGGGRSTNSLRLFKTCEEHIKHVKHITEVVENKIMNIKKY